MHGISIEGVQKQLLSPVVFEHFKMPKATTILLIAFIGANGYIVEIEPEISEVQNNQD